MHGLALELLRPHLLGNLLARPELHRRNATPVVEGVERRRNVRTLQVRERRIARFGIVGQERRQWKRPVSQLFRMILVECRGFRPAVAEAVRTHVGNAGCGGRIEARDARRRLSFRRMAGFSQSRGGKRLLRTHGRFRTRDEFRYRRRRGRHAAVASPGDAGSRDDLRPNAVCAAAEVAAFDKVPAIAHGALGEEPRLMLRRALTRFSGWESYTRSLPSDRELKNVIKVRPYLRGCHPALRMELAALEFDLEFHELPDDRREEWRQRVIALFEAGDPWPYSSSSIEPDPHHYPEDEEASPLPFSLRLRAEARKRSENASKAVL